MLDREPHCEREKRKKEKKKKKRRKKKKFAIITIAQDLISVLNYVSSFVLQANIACFLLYNIYL